MAYKDKEKDKEYKRLWYQRNKARIRESIRNNPRVREHKLASAAKCRARNQEYTNRVKIESGCVDCGLKGPAHIYDFDHIGHDKESNVSDLVVRTSSLDKIRKEIAKCEVVCANCHRIRTFNRKQ